MPVITDVTVVALNSTSANLIAGDINEFLARPSVVSLFCTGSAAGLRAQLLIGKDVVIDDQEISAANRFPITPDDFLSRGGGVPRRPSYASVSQPHGRRIDRPVESSD